VELEPTILEVKVKNEKGNKKGKKKIKKKKNDSEDLNSSLNDLISNDDSNNDSQYFQKLNDNSPIKVGLNNIGATCYMNATLQCLSNTDKLTDYFLKEYVKEPNKDNKIMVNAYYEVIKALWNRKNNNKSISPYDFKEILSQENPLFAGM
jgi:ubiquitin C-terminal hydrolase